MTLWEMAVGSHAKITGYNTSIDSGVQDRLGGLGFAIGKNVECVRHTPFFGPRVFEVSGTIFALEKQLAMEVIVQTVPKVSR
jgi:Fe2+ transport system protein FeoA